MAEQKIIHGWQGEKMIDNVKPEPQEALSADDKAVIAAAKKDGKRVGLVQGSWDMFHLGHLCYLQKARSGCDFLIVAMDDDEKIRYRKGNNRPIIPLKERYQTIEKLNIADMLVVKHLGEPHWGLIKTVRPDVLFVIKENYSDEELVKLKKFCGEVKVLPRQATTSTSDIIRRTLIKNGVKTLGKKDPRVARAVAETKARLGAHDKMAAPLPEMFERLKTSTDWVTPTVACCFHNGRWYFGVNQIDQGLSKHDIEDRTELFYSTVEHAEINLLKQLESVEKLEQPIFTLLFPCDKCMKVLIDRGVTKIYYLEDHPYRNWSKRSHQLAREKGVKLVKMSVNDKISTQDVLDKNGASAGEGDLAEEVDTATERKLQKLMSELKADLSAYKYIDPRNARELKQLEIMLRREAADEDPFDPAIIEQEIIYTGEHWYVSQNRFPYDEIETQFLIIARDAVYKIEKMSDEMWAELWVIWRKLMKEYHVPGGAMGFRFGDTLRSGASLKRLHVHLIVPKEGKKTKFGIGGRMEVKVS